jgi:hypothetical protein
MNRPGNAGDLVAGDVPEFPSFVARPMPIMPLAACERFA